MTLWSSATLAATISLVSMQYSAAHPVPHLHYEGETVVGDVQQLQEVYDRFVRCRLDCIGQGGGATAVLTLNGPGGSYGTGLELADFLRANHIATVVERGMQCYSACAFAFLGGSGYAPLQSVGTYIERMVEPGSIVGFHAPYAMEEQFLADLQERGAMESQAFTRNTLALMVRELVKWNIDPLVIFQMMSMGPDDSYDLVRPEDLYLTRTALPPTPTSSWVLDWEVAIQNACMRLLALYENSHPYEAIERLLVPYEAGIGDADLIGSLSGYRLSDSWLDVGHCSASDKSLATGGDLDLALFFNPVLQGQSRPIISFFNRNDGWSSAGIGGLPTKRIFQRGPMNHYFLPFGTNIDDHDLPGELAILENRFFAPGATLPPLHSGLDLVSDWGTRRISARGNIWVFEQVGSARLFEAAIDESYNFAFDHEAIGAEAFVREGRYPEGTRFAWFGFRSGGTSSVTHILVLTDSGGEPSPEELDLIRQLECDSAFSGVRLDC